MRGADPVEPSPDLRQRLAQKTAPAWDVQWGNQQRNRGAAVVR